MISWLKKSILFIQTKKILKKRLNILIKRRLIPVNLLLSKTLIAVALKKLVTEKQVEKAFDLGNRNREKILKIIQTFDLSRFISTSYFDDVNHKII